MPVHTAEVIAMLLISNNFWTIFVKFYNLSMKTFHWNPVSLILFVVFLLDVENNCQVKPGIFRFFYDQEKRRIVLFFIVKPCDWQSFQCFD